MTGTVNSLKIIAVIPAHMASVRFANKILFPFAGHPMVEHVRRRALLAHGVADVYVATCDQEIADVIVTYGGKVIMTGSHHQNGTTRVAESITDIDCSHVILLQGDEPLLLPQYIEEMIVAITKQPENNAWNCIAPLLSADELDRHSFVKCAVSQTGYILSCFRRSPSFETFEKQQDYIFKIMGMIGYRKNFLQSLVKMRQTPIELHDSVEQMRILEHGFRIAAVKLEKALPSVNEACEAALVEEILESDPEQKRILRQIFSD
jgi:3-deoxy-manno-octulosonate cytidylyltransferase (CMP-KDO synthetase)